MKKKLVLLLTLPRLDKYDYKLTLKLVPNFHQTNMKLQGLHLHFLDQLGHLAHLNAGDVLFSIGEPCQNVFLIIQGKVQCDAHGKEPLYREDGDILSLVDLITGSTHSRTCIGLTDVELLLIPKDQINEMLEAADNVMMMTMKASAVRVAIAQEGAPG